VAAAEVTTVEAAAATAEQQPWQRCVRWTAMTDEHLTERRAARVIVVNAANRVLLMHAVDPSRPDEPYWMTPGGGLDPGEDAATAASRELYEETGLRIEPALLGGPIRQETVDFPYEGVWYHQHQDLFAVRVESWTVASTALSPLEVRSFLGSRWWHATELVATDERYYPRDLPALLETIIAERVC
jgi:8-oxo-dGTP pyrophosphatase MutT (NUDIX family)